MLAEFRWFRFQAGLIPCLVIAFGKSAGFLLTVGQAAFPCKSQTIILGLKTLLSLLCKGWSVLYINDVVINQSDRLLERSAHVNNLWYLSNISAWSGLQNELFPFTLPGWMWNSLKSRLFTFGFVTVRCYCFIPGKKLLRQSCFSCLSVLPLGRCLLLQEIFFIISSKSLFVQEHQSIFNFFNEIFFIQIVR